MTHKRILFVCLGNICRSPAAQHIMESTAVAAQIPLICDSCGTANYHVGRPSDSRMRAALARAGYEYNGHRGRQFTRRDFMNFDLIVAQDDHNYADMLRLAQSDIDRSKLCKMRDFFSDEDRARFSEVPDPYYGAEDGFDEVIALLERSSVRLLAQLCYADATTGEK